MIKFTKLEAKNIMSVGNKPVVIQLDSHKKTLISGRNGSGKSTILVESLAFALYGKPYRDINKPQLVNTFNKKGLVVNLWFSIGKTEFEIRRGIGPNLFQIYKEGILIPEDASVGDYQTYLEKSILGMSYKTFKQLVVLGTAGFTPFMQMKTADRRTVVEDLLELHLFSKMTADNKELIATIQNSITQADHNIDLLEQKNQLLERQQAESKDQADAKIVELNDRQSDLDQKLGGSKIKVASSKASIEKLESAISDGAAKTKIGQLAVKIGNQNAQVGAAEKMRSFLSDNTNCPVCTQAIEEDFRNKKIFSLDMEIDQLGFEISTTKEDLDSHKKVQTRDELIQSKVAEFKQTVAVESANIRQYESQIESIKLEIEKIRGKEFKDNSTVLVALKAKREQLRTQRDDLVNDKYCHAVITAMLKDTGVKSVVINQFIPVVNDLINKYLADFGAPYSFELDSEFNETIKTRGMESFSYNSFSQGQKFRIDLAILFAWRDLIHQRTGSMLNLMVMDEVMDSAADTDGIECLVEILDRIKESVFIISHNEKLDAMDFDRRIDVRLVGRFSEIEESK